MSYLEIHAVPKHLYYHEVAYVRGLEAEIKRLREALTELRPKCCNGPCERQIVDWDYVCRLTHKIDIALIGSKGG